MDAPCVNGKMLLNRHALVVQNVARDILFTLFIIMRMWYTLTLGNYAIINNINLR